MKLKFQQKTNLNDIMLLAKENLNPTFTTTRNHIEIEVMKPSFRSIFGKWRANIKITLENIMNANPYKCATIDVKIYA